MKRRLLKAWIWRALLLVLLIPADASSNPRSLPGVRVGEIPAASTSTAGSLSAAMYSQLHTTDNVDPAVTATGSDQAGAYAITKPYTYVTGGNQATPNGVRLPAIASANVPHWVCNFISAPVQVTVTGIGVYPATGETILPLAANALDVLYASQCNVYVPVGTTSWRALSLLTKASNTQNYHSGVTGFYQAPQFHAGITGSSVTGQGDYNLVDNLASALDVTEGANSYANFVTTNSAERIVFGKPFHGTLSTVAAAGTNQATATAIAAGSVWVTVTASDGTKGVTLPTGSTATCVRIMSQPVLVTSVLNVYGHNSDNDTINGAAADAVYAQIAGSSLTYCTADGVAWFSY